jgi:alpha-galactosidase
MVTMSARRGRVQMRCPNNRYGLSTGATLLIALSMLTALPAGSQEPTTAAPAPLSTAEPPNPTIVRPSEDPQRQANGLALTPPMGWNSWNKFSCNINEKVVRGTADTIASNGMRDAGYVYVVIDDCWQIGRDPQGALIADPAKFPSGMKALAEYIHSKGLKFGIYSDAGSKTCGGRPGSQGHEYQDARTFAEWGIDYLKYDWCWTGTRNAEEAYSLMADALRSTGRDIVFSLCEWGKNQPWEWGPKIGNLWRTTSDIRNGWAGRVKYAIGMVDIVDLNEPLYGHAGPGHWNDPDMLQVGNGGMTDSEERAHFSLWAEMAAPLMAGNDIESMEARVREILLNKEVIAIDQDTSGVQGRRVRQQGDLEVWSKQLADGGRAVVLFNRGAQPAEMAAKWTEIGYPDKLSAEVRDLWTHKSLGRKKGGFSATVPSHGVVMVRVTP